MEPVDLAFFKLHSRLLESSVEDELVQVYLQAAREKAEAYCNRHFISKVAEKTFRINEFCPIASEDIISVSGFYSTVDEITNVSSYFNEYVKGIVVSRDYPINYSNLPTYTVKYNVTVDPSDIPAAVKIAICKIAADLYEFREHSSTSKGNLLTINFKTLLAAYRIL